MSKGSGRRRITPSDGLQYHPDTDMTNIEERGGAYHQSAKKELRLGLRTGAQPTADNRGRRYAGKGRKNDHRNWKSHTKGKQYEHNALARERQKDHRPCSDSVAANLREKSIAADVAAGYPCKVWSGHGRRCSVTLKNIASVSEKFLVKFGGDQYKGVADRMSQPYRHPSYSASYSYSYQRPPSPSLWKNPEPPLMKIGFAIFEEKVQDLAGRIRWGDVDKYGQSVW